MNNLSLTQQVALVSLRTLIGWHFLYEGYYKLVMPGWSAAGEPLARWSSAGYLKAATGPLAGLFRRMIEAGWTPWIDRAVVVTLIAIGLFLLLGLMTRIGLWGAVLLLALFYLLSLPLTGTPQPGSEGTYLIVNKNLIELVAVLVLLAFKTERVAGLDLLWLKKREKAAS
jgi:thiosulfate dehydrogenase [quinone] large subunit